uniref:Uncharacterized protein n=1 Tax=Oryza brachyantha TaxID=4533 RepID=J3MSC8_ORYBR
MDGAEPASVAMKAEEQYMSNSLFTGGFNSVTRAHLMDKVIESEVTHPQMAGAKGARCGMPACDGKVMRNERGEDIDPCECHFKICRDCYLDAQKDGCICPGCKEHYKIGEYADDDPQDGGGGKLHRPAPGGGLNTNKSLLARNQNGEFDHNRWLFESSGTYGYGNAFWPKGGMYDDDLDDDDDRPGGGGGGGGVLPEQKPFKPLTRKIPMPTSVISPYRIFIVIRMFVLLFYLTWRIRNPNMEALWLWGMSIVCELWFAFSWLLDMLPKVNPVNRSTDLAVLKEKFETPSASNPHGRSDLPGLDVFVSTADPEKEPVLTTANTILSILAVDYPVEKLACYVSDDGGALLTFEAMAEAASFANIWVPFCKKHDIEPRNPDSYFSIKGDPTKGKRRSDFVKARRKVKREYDEFKVRINGLPDSIRRRSDAFNAREDMKMLKHLRETGGDPSEQPKVKKATWMADGTHWPGTWAAPAPDHGKGNHAGILQVMLRPPSPDPLYGMHEEEEEAGQPAMLDFSDVDIRLPMLVYMSREKRPGYDHNKKAGAMNALVRCSAVMSNAPFMLNFDCDHYINNAQADKTEWGDRVGWIYGSVTEDVVTGYRMHNRGWRSVYCITKRDAFLGTAPINLTDRLHQVLRWATGSVEIFFSRNNAFLASRKLMFLQRVSYLNVGIYPFTSIFLLVYCFIPALSLFSGFFIVQKLDVAFLCYLLTMTITLVALGILEGLLKVMAGIEISFTLTAKAAADDNEDIYADLYIVKWSSLLIPPITIGMVNIIAIAFAFARTIYSDNPRWGKFIGGGFFSFWVLAHLYPFAKGLMGRRGKTPTIVFVWSGLLSITVSLLWVAISPPDANATGGARGGGFQFP